MAGPRQTDPPAERGGLSFALVALAAAACLAPVLVAVGSPSPGAAPPGAEAQTDDGCRVPSGLSPGGGMRARYTMLIRIKHAEDAEAYANPDQEAGGLKGRLRERDVFVINTRRHAATPERETEMVDLLRQSFPCNRIIALNGLARPLDSVGSMLSLLGDPRVFGLMLDWEEGDWNVARKATPSTRPWTDKFGPNRRRVHQRLGRLLNEIRRAGRLEKRLGLATAFYGDWSYGKLALTLNRRSGRIRRNRSGAQSVQTQAFCQDGSRSFGRAVRDLRRDYRIHGLATRGLAVQISFTDDPVPGDSRPVNDVPPVKAARCTRAALRRRGGGAILYWARPEAIRALVTNTSICRLRPPPEGRSGC